MNKLPELLAPAGNFEKMKVAFNYGADAVYLSGEKYGLRAASDNFDEKELLKASLFARKIGKKIYITLNGFLHDSDLLTLPSFLKFLEKIKVDAVICSDLGTISLVKKITALKIHLSTQASCLNLESAIFWKKIGVSRIILGREVAISEIEAIKKNIDIELEVFVHGAMCISYSGNCVISNYTFKRDSNRGGCKHSCRFLYRCNDLDAHIMSSKDLNALSVIDKLIDVKVDSVKIEGRMKSHHYLGTVCRAYREVIDFSFNDLNAYKKKVGDYLVELKKIPNREYFSGNLITRASKNSINYNFSKSRSNFISVGDVLEVVDKESIIIRVKSAFSINDKLEFVPFKGQIISLKITTITNLLGENIARTRPGMLAKVPYISGVEKNNIVRRGLV